MTCLSRGTRKGAPQALLLLFVWTGVTPGAQWTVGVYMCADNELLNNRAYEDLAEMTTTGSTQDVDIIVQVDNVARDTHPGCRRYRVAPDRLEPLGELGEVDMADSATLRGFAEFLHRRFPARNYFFVLWDHGDGWREGYGPEESKNDRRQRAGWRGRSRGDARTQAIIIDDSHEHMMGVSGGEFRRALAGVKEALGSKVRVLGMDACMMQSVEVAWEARDACEYILASEATVPATGWPYDKLLALLTRNPLMEVQDFLVQACSAYVAHYSNQSECMSAINVERLADAVEQLGAELESGLDPGEAGFREARAEVQTFTSSGRPCPADDQIDLIHFFELAPGGDADRVEQEFRRAVKANAASGDLANARGLSVWFPDQYLDFKYSLSSYSGLEFARKAPTGQVHAAWPGFLGAYFGYDDNRPSSVTILGHGSKGNDLTLWWRRAFDPSSVTYSLYQFSSRSEVFSDACDSVGAQWDTAGWTASGQHYKSSPKSFYSGSGENLDNRLTLKQAFGFDNAGLLTFSAFYDTEESQDSGGPGPYRATGGFKRDVCYVEWSTDTLDGPAGEWRALDSLYGRSDGWLNLGYLLPKVDRLHLRLRYKTDGSVSRLGVFVDDISIEDLGRPHRSGGLVAGNLPDTVLALREVAQGEWWFCVAAEDQYGNRSSVTELYGVTVEQYAEPYSLPAPFQDSCGIVVDFPPGTGVEVRIHTLSGALVRTLKPDPAGSNPCRDFLQPGDAVAWDGRNEAGSEVAAGLYLVVVRGDGFSRVGRIAKTGR
ncbi:MAG: immune inhibitor A [candidate division WOR-3 bacterium]|nr:MAG: immune inhibitor A [candidate division WOR-3 bacterium]